MEAKVTIYKTKTCQFCKQETEYLQNKGIQFEEVYVDDDEKKAEEMIKKSGQMGVPFTVIEKDGEEEHILGFDKDAINNALGIQ